MSDLEILTAPDTSSEDDQPSPLLSLVICTLDEADCIVPVIEEACAALAGIAHEIIVVDDSGDDQTSDAVLSVIARRATVRLIRRRGVRGLASAAMAGWDAARGSLLALMDGDGQHDPAQLAVLLNQLNSAQADFALVSRYGGDSGAGSGLSGRRHLFSRLATGVTRMTLGVRITDPLSGQFLFRRDWYQQARPRLSGIGFKILVDLVMSGERPARAVEAYGALRGRIAGASKLDLRVIAELMALIIAKRTNGLVPARLAMFLGVGAIGTVVHLATLQAMRAAGAAFWLAQATAILIAMTGNFLLNNALTFRDARLTGAAAVRGLGMFYVGCLTGAVLSEGLGLAIRAMIGGWVVPALTGAVAGALFNFHFNRTLTWRVSPRRLARGGQPEPAAPSVHEIHPPPRLVSAS
jgi:dolichol-phosphate mannosyltransferase